MNTGPEIVNLLKMLPTEKQEEFIKSASEDVVKLISETLEKASPEHQAEQEKLASAYKMGEAMGLGFINALVTDAEAKAKE